MKAREFITEAWSQKYKSSINCSHPKGFSQRAHCAGKKKHNESVETEMVCEMCGMCQTHGDHSRANLNEKCWDTHKQVGMKNKGGRMVPNCVAKESVTEDEDAMAAFVARGGQIQQLKPQRGPKRSGVSLASKHIGSGSGRGTTKGKVSGLGANTGKSGKPVVTAEQGVSEDLSRRGFLRGAGAAAVAGAAGPEIVTLVKGFAEQAGGMNGIQALKAMLKVATADELYNMYDYYSDSGILEDAITDSDMRALQRVKGFRDYEDWSDFEEYCEDNNDVNPVEEFERLTGRPLKVSLVDDIVGKIDDTWSLENFFDEYPDALKLINPFENGSISRPTMQQLGYIDTAAKGANLPAPVVAMANAVAGLVRQIFKANGQPLAAPQQVAQTSRAAPALPAPARPEFDMTPDLKTKQQVPVRGNGNDQEQALSEGICSLTEAHAIFDDFEQAMAARGLTEDVFETITDEQIIRETAAWRRKAGKSAKGGLNAKGVASYRRENPGSKLQMAVTTKPSKLKPGSKAAKRRKSFCARMSGVKGPMKKPNGKPTRKALALRKWNC
jgi:hypothetical protein